MAGGFLKKGVSLFSFFHNITYNTERRHKETLYGVFFFLSEHVFIQVGSGVKFCHVLDDPGSRCSCAAFAPLEGAAW